MSDVRPILVVGGGVVGLAAAVAMAARGFAVSVLDAASLTKAAIQKSTRVYAINAASQALLERLGVWEQLTDEDLSPYQGMQVRDANSQAELTFDARTFAQSTLGFILKESSLRCALLTCAKALGVTLVSDACVFACETHAHGMRITTEDARIFEAEFCMISDGANSKMRDLLKIPMTTWPYHHHAMVATIQTEKPHQKTAYQVFSADGPLAFLPLKDPHECSIVWSHPKAQIETLRALDKAAFEAALEKAFLHQLGALKLQGSRVSFPLHMRHVTQYVGDAWMLLGDAAHTIHPLAGLGLNVGLADLATWLKLLDKKKQPLTARSRLQAYQRERKYAVWQVVVLMQAIKTTFELSFMPVMCIRDLGMQLVNQVLPLKRLMMAYAAGVDKESVNRLKLV